MQSKKIINKGIKQQLEDKNITYKNLKIIDVEKHLIDLLHNNKDNNKRSIKLNVIIEGNTDEEIENNRKKWINKFKEIMKVEAVKSFGRPLTDLDNELLNNIYDTKIQNKDLIIKKRGGLE